MSKRQQRKRATEEFISKQFDLLFECLKESTTVGEGWDLFLEKYVSRHRYGVDQVYRQRIITLRNRFMNAVKKCIPEKEVSEHDTVS